MGELILITLVIWLIAIICYGAAEKAADDRADAELKQETRPVVDYGYAQKGWY